jgi:hypothetical protein
MGNWVRCTEYEEIIDKRDSPILWINLDRVRYMVARAGGSTALFYDGDVDEASLTVHGTPEQLIAGG